MNTCKKVFVAIAILFCSFESASFAGDTHDVLSLQRIFKKPYLAGSRPLGPKLSPDGKMLFFQWDSTAHNKYRHWLMHTDGTDMHLIGDTLIGEAEWAPDSRTIACIRSGDVFLTDTSFHSFTRLTKTEAYENNLHWSQDGKLLAFNSDKSVFVLPVGINGMFEVAKTSAKEASVNMIDFLPDNKRVVIVESSNDGLPEFIVPRYTGKDVTTRSFKSGVGTNKIGIAPIDTGATLWIKLPGDDHFFLGDIVISPDGKQIVIERYTSNRKEREIFVADTDSGKAKLIFDEKDDAWVEGGSYSTRWMPDGRQIVMTSEKDGWNHLYTMSPDGSHLQKITNGDWEIRWFDIAPSGEKVFFLANSGDHAQWQVFSLDTQSKSIIHLSAQEGTYENTSLSKDGSIILANYSNFGHPTELVRMPTTASSQLASRASSGAGQATNVELQLTNTVPNEFKQISWVVPEIIQFKSRDGVMVPAMIYKPADFNPAKKYPVVVFVHGAGYLQNVYRGWSYYYREYMFNCRLTQRGYIVYEVEYRGSAGLGRKFRADVYMYLGGKDLDDEVDGLEYLKHLGYIDSSRVGIYGGSYGGFMTLMGLFRTNKYTCGAALRAVTSWENYYRHNPWYTEARLGKPEQHAEAYKISSPITYADSLKNPLLILHGMVDDNVFFQDAVQLISKLQKSEKKFETMFYPEEAHGFSDPDSWLDEYSRIEEFFDRYLLTANH